MKAVLAFILSLTAAFPARAAFTCEGVFESTPSAREYAASLGVHDPQGLIEKILFRRYLRKWSPQKTYSAVSFEKRINQSYDLIRRLRIRKGLLDNRQRDFNATPEELVLWAEKALMKNGLRGYRASLSDRYRMERILRSRFMMVLESVLTLSLPDKPDRAIPNRLLAEMLLDGVEPHIPELRSLARSTAQNDVETWRRWQVGLKYFMLVANALILFQQLEQRDAEQTATAEKNAAEGKKQYEQIDHSLDKLEAAIDAI